MTDRINLDIVDMYVDLTYGLLLLIGVVSIIVFNRYTAAITFGVGVLTAYAVHVGWRMARFDPDTADRIRQAVDETVEDHVDDLQNDVEETVEETIEEEVETNVAEQVGQAQSEIEETVEETVSDVVDDTE